METYWEGWGKKTGKENKRWKRRYLRLHGMEGGARGLFYYESDRKTSAGSANAIPFKDATGLVHFSSVSASALAAAHLEQGSGGGGGGPGAVAAAQAAAASSAATEDLKFAILTPARIWMLGFEAPERQHGLLLLRQLYAVLNKVDVLAEGWLAKKRHTLAPPGAMAVWRRHYFVYVATGELLFFADETLSSLQGRVDVRHSPRLRVSGGNVAAGPAADDQCGSTYPPCLVSISVPNAKPLLLRLHEGGAALPPSARSWLELLRHGHAANKHSQLERCVSSSNYQVLTYLLTYLLTGDVSFFYLLATKSLLVATLASLLGAACLPPTTSARPRCAPPSPPACPRSCAARCGKASPAPGACSWRRRPGTSGASRRYARRTGAGSAAALARHYGGGRSSRSRSSSSSSSRRTAKSSLGSSSSSWGSSSSSSSWSQNSATTAVVRATTLPPLPPPPPPPLPASCAVGGGRTCYPPWSSKPISTRRT